MTKRKMTEEHKRKISNALKGRHISPSTEFKNGHKSSEESKQKIISSLTGRKHSESTKRKMSISRTGIGCGPTKGTKFPNRKRPPPVTKEHRRNLSKAGIGKHTGSKCSFWKGGISNDPYSNDWRETLRRSIRERDRYTCQLCGLVQDDRTHSVHHIDYDKKNSNPINLITLCHKCHANTNYDREHWTTYFQEIAMCWS